MYVTKFPLLAILLKCDKGRNGTEFEDKNFYMIIFLLTNACKQAILFVIQAGVLAAIKLGLEECWIGCQGLRTQEFS